MHLRCVKRKFQTEHKKALARFIFVAWGEVMLYRTTKMNIENHPIMIIPQPPWQLGRPTLLLHKARKNSNNNMDIGSSEGVATAQSQLPNNQEAISLKTTTTIQQFVPCQVSLKSDAPGWNLQTEQNHDDDHRLTTTTIDETKPAGPICWKCHGVDRPKKPCTVCHGQGRLPVSKRQKTKHLQNTQGVIKAATRDKGFQRKGPLAAALNDTTSLWVKMVHQADQGVDGFVQQQPESKGEKSRQKTDDNSSTSRPAWLPGPGEQLVKLLGHWRILQRVGSHRWTTDDLVTAYVANTLLDKELSLPAQHTDQQPIIHYLDLGCGNGSVLQMTSWSILSKLASHTLDATGVEARSEAVGLARRSLNFNVGTPTRTSSDISEAVDHAVNIQVQHADFRQFIDTVPDGTTFDLITGTPPYFRVDFEVQEQQPEGSSPKSARTIDSQQSSSSSPQQQVVAAVIRQGGMPASIQSAPARCEFRGGIEAYCETAARVLHPTHGRFVVCNNYINHERSLKAATDAGMQVVRMLLVEGCRGRGTLFVVYVMKMIPPGDKQIAEKAIEEQYLTVREATGEWTRDYVDSVFTTMSIPGPKPKG